MMNLGDLFGKAFGGRTTRRRMTVADSYDLLISEEAGELRLSGRSRELVDDLTSLAQPGQIPIVIW